MQLLNLTGKSTIRLVQPGQAKGNRKATFCLQMTVKLLGEMLIFIFTCYSAISPTTKRGKGGLELLNSCFLRSLAKEELKNNQAENL